MNATPEVHVAMHKSRVKSKDGTVYLSNSSEFELELYNPTQEKISAQISINGQSMSYDLVIRPAERIFLERSLDHDKKFKFETYTVGISKEDLTAIAKNGLVEVKFYREQAQVKKQPIRVFPNSHDYLYDLNKFQNPLNHNNFFYHQDLTGQAPQAPFTYTTSTTTSCDYSAPINEIKLDSMETGRIEKGSISNQSFLNSTDEFSSFPFHQVSIRIKPISQETPAPEYCSCGRRARNKENFCPKCGTKLKS